MTCSFDDFFRRATGNAPYPYQRKLATGDDFPELLDVPTGLGKTAVLAWLKISGGK
jgi:CRISPR-associated endonuclease/helicase Cas3